MMTFDFDVTTKIIKSKNGKFKQFDRKEGNPKGQKEGRKPVFLNKLFS